MTQPVTWPRRALWVNRLRRPLLSRAEEHLLQEWVAGVRREEGPPWVRQAQRGVEGRSTFLPF